MALVAEPLSEHLKQAGAKMLAELDRIGLDPQGALWLHYPLVQDWRFVVITPLVDALGRLKVYGLIGDALDALEPTDGLTLLDIHLYSPEEIVPQNLTLVGVEQANVEITSSRLNGMLVDAFMYRMRATLDEKQVKKTATSFQKRVRALAA